MNVFQNKNRFLGFAFNDTRKLANIMQVHSLSLIVNSHNSINMCSIPVNNQCTTCICDCLTLVLEKSSKKNIMWVILVDGLSVNVKLAR